MEDVAENVQMRCCRARSIVGTTGQWPQHHIGHDAQDDAPYMNTRPVLVGGWTLERPKGASFLQMSEAEEKMIEVRNSSDGNMRTAGHAIWQYWHDNNWFGTSSSMLCRKVRLVLAESKARSSLVLSLITLLITFDPLSVFVCSAFRVCSIVFSIRVLLDPRRGSRITHCADENPGVPTVPTGIQEYPLCQPGSRVPPPEIQEYPSTGDLRVLQFATRERFARDLGRHAPEALLPVCSDASSLAAGCDHSRRHLGRA